MTGSSNEADRGNRLEAIPATPLTVLLSTGAWFAWTVAAAATAALAPGVVALFHPSVIAFEYDGWVQAAIAWCVTWIVLGLLVAPLLTIALRFEQSRQATERMTAAPPLVQRQHLMEPPFGMILMVSAWVFGICGPLALILITVLFEQVHPIPVMGLVASAIAVFAWAVWLWRYSQRKAAWARRVDAVRQRWDEHGGEVLFAPRQLEVSLDRLLSIAQSCCWIGFLGSLLLPFAFEALGFFRPDDGEPSGAVDPTMPWVMVDACLLIFAVGIALGLVYGVLFVAGLVRLGRNAHTSRASSDEVADAVRYGHPMRWAGVMLIACGVVVWPIALPLGAHPVLVGALIAAGVLCLGVGQWVEPAHIQRILDAHPTVNPGPRDPSDTDEAG